MDPIHTYCILIWARLAKFQHLHDVWHKFYVSLVESHSPWSDVIGPLTTAFASIRMIAWYMKSPMELVTHLCEELHLIRDCPATVVRLVEDGHKAKAKHPFLSDVKEPWSVPVLWYLRNKNLTLIVV